MKNKLFTMTIGLMTLCGCSNGLQKTEKSEVLIDSTMTIETNLDLIVKSGETLTINNRTYQYNNVIIERNATLIITEQSTRWFILWASGDVKIEGKVIANNFRVGPRTVNDKTPDGKTLSHTFNNDTEGGAGGNGGIAVGGTPGSRSGGRGANGNTKAGGGGGSGGGIYIAGPSTRLGGNGRDASDWRGAPLAELGFNNQGGDGGRLNSHCNGGLIFIYCGGTFIGQGGQIDIKGSQGENGNDGGRGTTSNRGYCGGGGGGGGAPGGEGGHLIIVAKNLQSECTVNANGGKGGIAGNSGQPPYQATKGYNGDNGSAGIVDWLTLNQW